MRRLWRWSVRPSKYSIQRSLHRTSWLHDAKSFVCFTAICLGRGMTKITHSLLLLVPLFHRYVVGLCFHWKWWHDNVSEHSSLFPTSSQVTHNLQLQSLGSPLKPKLQATHFRARMSHIPHHLCILHLWKWDVGMNIAER